MRRHAYLIMAHHSWEQLRRLTGFLDSSDADSQIIDLIYQSVSSSG